MPPSSPMPPPTASPAPSRRSAGGMALLVGGTATVVLATVFAAVTGGSPAAFLATLLAAGWPAALWLLAAWGFGRLVAPPLVGRGLAGPATSLALGVALLLVLDSAALRLSATPAVAWGLVAMGVLAALADLVRGRRVADRATPAGLAPGIHPIHRIHRIPRPPLVLLGIAVVPAAIMLAAAASAPGWLWTSEFGGYDALSYHLQLPAEWAEAGRAAPLRHNVYSFMPNAVEHGFLHVGLLAGDPRTAGPAAQFLHAAMALGAASAVGGLAQVLRRRTDTQDDDVATADPDDSGPAFTGWVAGVLVLATPWVVVTGSLAYTEMAVLWLFAASLRLAAESGGRPDLREGLAHGLLAGAATAAKLTAGPLAVVPAIIWWLLVRRDVDGPVARRRAALPTPWRRIAPVAVGGLVAGSVALAPWLLAGALHAGNPLFPFATGVLGPGHWTAEQVAAWRAGHGGGGGLTDLAREWLVHGIAGEEPPQWGLLPVAGLLACGVMLAATRRGLRPIAAATSVSLAFAVLAWAAFTHAESRFLLPTAVLLAVAIALVPARGPRRNRPRPASWAGLPVLVLALVAGQATWTVAVAAGERDGAAGRGIGAGPIFRGEAHEQAMIAARARGDRAALAELRALAPPTWWTRFGLGSGARVLMIGEAAVLHHPPAVIAYRTVWDRDRLTDWLDDADAASASEAVGWAVRARAEGYTHVLVDRAMLENWAERGWNDPRMRWETLRSRAGVPLEPVASFDGGARILVQLGAG